MTAVQSFRLYELTLEFLKDKDKAKEYVSKIEEVLENKLTEKSTVLATKNDIADTKKEIAEVRKEIVEAKVDIIKWLVGTAIAIVGLLTGLMIALLPKLH